MKKQKLAWSNLQESIDAAGNAFDKGTAQYFTPEPIARALALPLTPFRPVITDFHCGTGSLPITAANKTTERLLGVDIDPESIAQFKQGKTLVGDITALYPLFVEVGWQADLFTLNPPFSLQWHTDRLKKLEDSTCDAVREAWQSANRRRTVDSTLATFLIALDRLSERGEGYLICPEFTACRLFGTPGASDNPLQSHIWAWVTMGNYFPGVDPTLKMAALYFSRDHDRGPGQAIITIDGNEPEKIAKALQTLATDRNEHFLGLEVHSAYESNKQTLSLFDTVREEWKSRNSTNQEFNIWLAPSGRIVRHLTPFQEVSSAIPSDLIKELNSLQGQTPISLVVQKATRLSLLRCVNSNVWRVDPDLIKSVNQAVTDYDSVRAPFYPLNDIQRLGYLDEADAIDCKRSMHGFTMHGRYPLTTETIELIRKETRLDLEGIKEEVEIKAQELLIKLTDDFGDVHAFAYAPKNEGITTTYKHDLETLVRHFEIPSVPDIAMIKPEPYAENIRKITRLEKDAGQGFKFKHYQREDIARALIAKGGILSWDQGLGKTIGIYTFGVASEASSLLIVAPGSLHEQIMDEGKNRFGISVKPLMSQEAFYLDEELQEAIQQKRQGIKTEKAVWRITSYEALGYNGADEAETDNKAIIAKRHAHPEVQKLIRTETQALCNLTAKELPPQAHEMIAKLRRLATNHAAHPGEIVNANAAIQRIITAHNYALPDNSPNMPFQLPTDLYDYLKRIGHVQIYKDRPSITCIFTPCLGTLCADAFDCVMTDEGVRLKSDDSFISLGVRKLRPEFRLVLTGTPIKNRLNDIFWLAHWSCGGHYQATARWPYEDSNAARECFAEEHMITEKIISKKGSKKKRTSRLCNVHRLWKLLGPVVVRRRKDDCGSDIVTKTLIPVSVVPGKAQQLVYARYLKYKPVATKAGIAVNKKSRACMQVQNLRLASLCPDSINLGNTILGPEAVGPRRSWTDLNPKAAACHSLVVDLLERGEQVIIMSPFYDFSDRLTARLEANGVSVCLLDGRTSPTNRGKLAKEFKKKKFAVMVAGIESMSEGHSFECCANLVLPGISWAFDKNAQAIDRVHRLNSPKPVNIYILITKGTIDEKLYSLFNERKDSAQLALDGSLFRDNTEEVNPAALIAAAVEDFDPASETIDEQKIENEWKHTAARLRNAERAFRQYHPNVSAVPALPDAIVSPSEMAVEATALGQALQENKDSIKDRLKSAMERLKNL